MIEFWMKEGDDVDENMIVMLVEWETEGHGTVR